MRTIEQLMSTDCVTITSQDNLFEAAIKMKQQDIGFIPVVDGKKLVGVVTDRDLVLRGYAEKRPGSSYVEEVMSTDVSTIQADATVEEAAQQMASERVRRLPVVRSGELIGVVALADLAVREVFVDEAGKALHTISENVDHSATIH